MNNKYLREVCSADLEIHFADGRRASVLVLLSDLSQKQLDFKKILIVNIYARS